ncbi:hypothetical protein [Microvirga lotononidis]|nr:hypothetical protein [Microvirga lotononidis]WQO27542.1 hypothetical protein U0023_00025 [Microvirga lotononidis]
MIQDGASMPFGNRATAALVSRIGLGHRQAARLLFVLAFAPMMLKAVERQG